MIVFYGRADDTPLARALEEAAELGVDHVLLDQGTLEHDRLELQLRDGALTGRVSVAGRTVDLAEVTAVYGRPLDIDSAARRGAAAAARARAFHYWCLDWLEMTEALVVNRPSAMASNGSKPLQAQLIAAAGFAVPATLVTNDPEQVLRFRAEHGRLVYKSASGIRSIVRELDDEALQRLDRVRQLPTQFQAYVPGVDVRVHVIGETPVATRIDSPATDYRYAARDGLPADLSPTELDRTTARACVRLAAELGLAFCGIDLRVRPDGGIVCFEVNPMPAFSFFEESAGQPIARLLVELLVGASPGCRAGEEVAWSRSSRT